MKIWVDAHLSPAIATWIGSTFKIEAVALRDLGLRDAEDPEIFEAAKAQEAIALPQFTRFSPYVTLLSNHHNPLTVLPVVWLGQSHP